MMTALQVFSKSALKNKKRKKKKISLVEHVGYHSVPKRDVVPKYQ